VPPRRRGTARGPVASWRVRPDWWKRPPSVIWRRDAAWAARVTPGGDLHEQYGHVCGRLALWMIGALVAQAIRRVQVFQRFVACAPERRETHFSTVQ